MALLLQAYAHKPQLSGPRIHFVTTLLYCYSTRMQTEHETQMLGAKSEERSAEEQKQECPVAAVDFQLPMYSCRDALATVWNSHKFGSTGYI